MTTALQADLFRVPLARREAKTHKPMSRVLHVAEPLPARSGDDVAWVRALLAEHSAAHDSQRRAKTYAMKPTTSGRESASQVELYQKHLVRQERVVLALVEAIKGRHL